MAIREWPEKAKEKFDDLVEWVKSLLPENPHQQAQRQEEEDPPEKQEAQPQESEMDGRYQVQSEQQEVAHQTDSLEDALDAWKQQTDQNGFIVDLETGEDITPEKEETGRFVVMDENGDQVGSFDEFDDAVMAWQQDTGKNGRIMDTVDGEEVTPFSGHLTDSEVQEVLQLINKLGGNSFSRARQLVRRDNTISEGAIMKLVEQINSQRLPIFELANAVGDGIDVPTTSVTVTKRRVTVKPRQVPYVEDVPIDTPPTEMHRSPTPADDTDRRPMESYGELPRVRPVDMVRPDFARRFAQRDLTVDEHLREVPADVKTTKVTRFRTEEDVVPEEWEEEIEVTDQTKVQNLVIVCDMSGSMYDYGSPQRIEMAIALCLVLIGKHLDDDSRYGFRWFATSVDKSNKGDSRRSKESLMSYILKGNPTLPIGGGTNIYEAIHKASNDARRIAGQGEIPEVLLVTDGQDFISASDVYNLIGEDVILHTVMIDGWNDQLRRHSTTYYELSQSSVQPRYQRW